MAITGSLAPQGMNVVVMAVMRLSLSLLMVLEAMTPGTAAGSHEEGDEGLSGETEVPEHAVHHEGDPCHVSDVLEDAEGEEHEQHLGQESDDGTDSSDDSGA